MRDALSRSPLGAARVEVVGEPRASVTDRDGSYTLRTLAPGPNTVRVTRTGYDTVTLDAVVPTGLSLRLDVALHRRPTRLPALEVSTALPSLTSEGASSPGGDGAEVGFRSLSPATLRHDPLATTTDPLLAIARGVVFGTTEDFPSAVHLRGGSADQNLVLLDGLPVYGLMHLGGAGSILSPDAVAQVDVHPAGQPAGPAGRLSSTIAVTLHPPGRPGTTAEGGIDRLALWQTLRHTSADSGVAVLVSGRRSYRGVLTQTVGENGESNGFDDYLGHASRRGPRDRLDLYLLTSRDRVGFQAVPQAGGSSSGETETTADTSRTNTSGDTSPVNRFAWSSHTAGLVWRHATGPGRTVAVRAWDAGSSARIGWSTTAGTTGVRNELRDIGGSAELAASGPAVRRSLGASVQQLDLRYDIAGPNAGVVTSGQPARHASPLVVGAWLDEERRVGSRVIVRAGLRANLASGFQPSLEPRLSGRWALSRNVAILLGYNRSSQYVQSLRNEESPMGHASGADLPAAGLGNDRPARADQLSTGVEARFGGATVRLDSYLRWFDHLAIVPANTAAPFAVGAVPIGSGWAHGIELDVAHHGERIDARIATGLAQTRRRAAGTEFSPGAGHEGWLSAGVRYHLGGAGAVSMAATYASGSATSLIAGDLAWRSPSGLASDGEISGSPHAIVGGLNATRLPAYFRVDVGISRDWSFGTGAGLRTLGTSLTLTNLFDHRNAMGLALAPFGRSVQTILSPGRSLDVRVSWHF